MVSSFNGFFLLMYCVTWKMMGESKGKGAGEGDSDGSVSRELAWVCYVGMVGGFIYSKMVS